MPYDLVMRARRVGGQSEQDLLDIARINSNRVLYIVEASGLVLMAICCFVLTGLATLGFFYDVEFAQAVFLLLLPMCFVMMISIAAARRLQTQEATVENVSKTLTRSRTFTQIIGMFSILITAFWGMYQNISIGVLG